MTTNRHRRQQSNNITIFVLAVLFQSKLNISNYELMNEECIVFVPCFYIKAKNIQVQLSLKSHKLRHVSTR